VAERVTDGAHISPDTENGLYDFVSTRDVKGGTINFAGSLKTTQETYDYMVKTGCRPNRGDVLFSKDGTVGETAIVTEEHNFVVASSLVIITPQLSVITPSYLAYIFASRPAQEQAASFMRGAGLPRLSVGNLARLEVLVPPLDEQRAFADYLDRETARIDMLIQEQQRLIEMLRERRTAVIAHATSQGADVELRRVISVLRQGWSPNCESWPADGVAEWGVLKVGCANTGRFDPAENKRLPDNETPRPELAVRQGEIVISRSNTKDLVGAAAVVDGGYPRLLLSDLTYGLLLTDDADPAFVAYALGSPSMRWQISAASKGMSHSMQKISQRDIRELRVRLPPLGEQRRAAAYLDRQTAKIDALTAETERFIELARDRRAALITAAVTGQIDVRETA